MASDGFCTRTADFKHLSESRHSCKYCQRIVLNPTTSSTPVVTEYGQTISTNSFEFTAGEIAQAERDDCLLFQRLARNEDDPPGSAEAASRNPFREDANATKIIFVDFLFNSYARPRKIFNSDKRWTATAQWRWADALMRPVMTLEPMTYYLDAEADDPASSYISDRPMYPYIYSDVTIDLVQSWIQDCDERHKECREAMKRHFSIGRAAGPSRIIDIGAIGNDDVRIVTSDPGIEYVALSYCWGGDESMKLLKSNLGSWEHNVPFCQLPRTIRDAINTTRRLGQQYLWIDRLCIVQDDVEEMNKELQVMAEIYRMAYITISASSAKSSADGFLQTREVASALTARTQIVLPYRCPDGTHGLVGMNGRGDFFRWSMGLDTKAVDARAWTFQEQHISTRFVGLCSNAVTWTCKMMKVIHKHDETQWKTERMAESSFLDAEDDTLINWRTIIERYSGRKISSPGDKLIAVSSVAQEFGKILRRSTSIIPNYLAGLWKHELSQQLCWYRPGYPENGILRPATYRAPSWSWASVDGAVVLENLCDSEMRVEVLECSVELVSPLLPYGAVSSGHLTVRGRIIEQLWNVKIQILKSGNTSGPGSDGCLWSYPDAIESSLPKKQEGFVPVFCLLMATAGTDPDDRHREEKFGLILVPAGEKTYRRVGFFRSDEDTAFERSPPQVVTIV
ncbi:hypothetical protein LSUE1_G007031 [Lachnellula suecica]|uniref:Heterokaryon incompatibility domain-containing protein n=1 Tax=Lachnellula suecica TaxID=602035 RepID=A0A8T9BXE2_9HELO|nr:hypothetical protein LSUE1_G007031 [Lachnellula suecica]